MQGVTELLIPGAIVVVWIVGLEVAPDLIRSIIGFFQELL